MKRKTAIILARVSTAGQAEEELPIASQLDAGHAKAAKLDADVVKVFLEEGVSGRKEKRSTFDEAAEYCRLFAVDYFILWNTARFARHRAIAAYTKWKLRRGGTQMVYVSQDIDTSTRGGRLLEGLFEIMDEDYAQQVSEDTLRSMMRNAREGFFNGGRAPYGYAVVPDGKRKKLAIREDEAAVVRQIFSECRGGMGTKSIALMLNQQGLRRRGQMWTKNTVGYLLGNWVYAGYVTFNRVNHATRAKRAEEDWVRTLSHPAIISEEEFTLVQQVIQRRAPEREGGSVKSQFRLTGLARCGRCGMGMQIQTGTGRLGTVYSYYRCTGALQGKGCKAPAPRAEALDESVLEALATKVFTKENLDEMAREIEAWNEDHAKQRDHRRQLLVTQLRDAEVRRGKLYDVLEQHGRDAPNLADLTQRLRQLNAQIRELEAALTELEQAAPARPAAVQRSLDELGEFAAHMLRTGEAQKVRHFLSTFVDAVAVNEDGAVVTMRPGNLIAGGDGGGFRVSGKWLPDQGLLRTTLKVPLPARVYRRAA